MYDWTTGLMSATSQTVAIGTPVRYVEMDRNTMRHIYHGYYSIDPRDQVNTLELPCTVWHQNSRFIWEL